VNVLCAEEKFLRLVLRMGPPLRVHHVELLFCSLYAKWFCFVMTSYHFSNSCFVCGSIRFCVMMLARIVLISFTGMLEYKFVMSNEERA